MRSKILILTLFYLFFGASPVFASTVKINEFLAHPSTGNSEWVEFYNPDNIDLSSYWIDDDTSFTSDSGSSSKKSLSTLNTTNSTLPFIELSSFLNNSADFVVLFSNDGTVIDEYQYTQDTGIDTTIGRNPDGGNWTTLSASSQGASNNTAAPPTLSQTASPQPSALPESSPNPTQTSSFIVSNTPSQINSDQSFSITVNLFSPNNPSTKLYLKGAFIKPDGSNYFGQTKVSGSWVKNNSSYSNQFSVTTDSSGNWSGNLEVKPDSDDSGFTGTGDYIFKVGQYNSADTSPSVSWSNETTINITDVSNSPNDSPTTKPTAKAIPTNPPVLASTKSTTKSPQPKSDTLVYHSATVAGATASAVSKPAIEINKFVSNEIKSQKQTNPIIWVGLILVFTGTSMIGYIYFRKNAKIRKIRI